MLLSQKDEIITRIDFNLGLDALFFMDSNRDVWKCVRPDDGWMKMHREGLDAFFKNGAEVIDKVEAGEAVEAVVEAHYAEYKDVQVYQSEEEELFRKVYALQTDKPLAYQKSVADCAKIIRNVLGEQRERERTYSEDNTRDGLKEAQAYTIKAAFSKASEKEAKKEAIPEKYSREYLDRFKYAKEHLDLPEGYDDEASDYPKNKGGRGYEIGD